MRFACLAVFCGLLLGSFGDALSRDAGMLMAASRDVFRPWSDPVKIYGPIAVCDHRGRLFIDAAYDATRPNDDRIPLLIAGRSSIPVASTPLALEGGNLLSNGHGLCITTSALVDRNAEFNVGEDAVRRHLRTGFGATQIVILEPLAGEPTGHVDMFATFTNPDTVVVGAYDPAEEPENAALLDRNAARLAASAAHCTASP